MRGTIARGARLPRRRPRLALVLALLLGTVPALPLAGLFFRIYDGQLIRQAEGELVA